MQASTSANTTAAAGGRGVGGTGESTALRACNTSGCRVSKFVEVSKRKCSQFVSAPYIMPKPLLVNNKTSIFQVGGELAKMGDIPSLASATGAGNGQPIYRIKPGTHAHVINYVFIDEGSDSMEKANSEDKESIRMLLDSQRESATAKLQKLINTHRGGAQTVAGTTPRTTTAAQTATGVTPASSLTTIASTLTVNNVHVSTPQIHPDLSITSVAGALPLTANLSPATVSTPAPASVPSKRGRASNTTTITTDNSVNQLQDEIRKLQRSVARLSGVAKR